MRQNLPKIGPLLKRHFFAGVLVLIPLAVIFWIIVGALGSLWRLHELVPDAWKPADPALGHLVNLLFTLGSALVLALGISILGWASKQYLGQKILEFIGEQIQRIPVIRSVYGALDQLLRTIASQGGQQFHRVVYVEYPRKGSWAIAFVTCPAKFPGGAGYLNVYVPTTPNPTSGFHLIVPESEVRESDMKVEDAFRTILSLGMAQGRR